MIVYCALIAVFSTLVKSQECSVGYSGLGPSCYAYVDHKMNWADAQSTCAALGGFLAEVFSAEENHFLQNLSRTHGSHAVWLGGDDLVQEGAWTWAKSSVPIKEYTDWAPGQPDTTASEDENCMEMNVGRFNGHWNDDQCYHEQRFICQKPAENTIVG